MNRLSLARSLAFAVLFVFGSTAWAGGEKKKVIAIESAMRAWHERQAMLTSIEPYWPPNKKYIDAGPTPRDGFYGEDLLDEKFAAQLVWALYDEMWWGSGMFLTGAIGPGLTWNDYHHLPDYWTIDETNYLTAFAELVAFLNVIKTAQPFVGVDHTLHTRSYGRAGGASKSDAISATLADLHSPMDPHDPNSPGGTASLWEEAYAWGANSIYFQQHLIRVYDGSWYARLWNRTGSVRANTNRWRGTAKIYKSVSETVAQYTKAVGFETIWGTDITSSTHTTLEPFALFKSIPAGGLYSDSTVFVPSTSDAANFAFDVQNAPTLFQSTSASRTRSWSFTLFVEADFNIYVRDLFQTIVVDCPPCQTFCLPGDVHAANECVDVTIGLGNTEKQSAGSLWVYSDLPDSNLTSPSFLRLKNEHGLTVTRALDSSNRAYMRQIVAGQAFIDIVIDDAHSYRVNFYLKSQMQDPGTDGIRTVTGSPYKTITISNPLATSPLSQLEFTVHEGGVQKEQSLFIWDNALNAWDLIKSAGGKSLSTKRIPLPSPGLNLRQEIVEDRDGTNLKSKRKLTFKAYPWNLIPNAPNKEELVEEVIDPDGAALTTSYQYYETTDATIGALAGRLALTIRADGHWQRTQYFDAGETTYVTSPWGNTAHDAAGPVKFVHRKISPTNSDVYSIEEGFEDTSGKFRTNLRFEYYDYDQTVIYHSREVQGSSYSDPYFDASSPDYLRTIRSYYNQWSLDGNFAGRLFREANSDGTGRVYSYRYVAGGLETTVYEGALTTEYFDESWPTEPTNGVFASDQDVITKGTKTVSVTNQAGETVEQSVTDVESGEVVSFFQATDVDAFGRVLRRDYHDGTYEEFAFACCGLDYKIDRQGIRTDYRYDAFGGLESTQVAGVKIEQTEEFVDGALNLVTTRFGSDNSSVELSREVRDLAGRIISRKEYDTRTTLYSEVQSPNGETVKTTTYPGGGTRIETYYRSGQLKSVGGTAAAPKLYEYGYETGLGFSSYYNSPVGYYVKEIKIGSLGEQAEWTKTIFDSFSRPIFKIYPGTYTGTTFPIWEELAYAEDTTAARLIVAADADAYARLFEYNELGEQSLEVQDIDWDWEIQTDGVDRVKRTTRSIATRTSGVKVQRVVTEIWTEDENDEPGKSVTLDVSLDGLTTWQTIKDLDTGKELTTKTEVNYDRATATRTETTTYPDATSLVTTYQNGRLQSNVRRNSSGGTVAQVSYGYDAHGRVEAVTDSSFGTTNYTYYDDDQVQTITTPDPDAGKSGPGYDRQTTTMVYDDAGRLWQTTLPDNRVEIRKYHPTGRLKLLYGGDNYPRQFSYDAQGRVKTLTTWQNFNPTTETGSGTAVTTWNYHPDRGWLTSKVLPQTTVTDSLGVTSTVSPTVSYEYTEGGRVKVKTGARGITTTYDYNDAGELWTLTYSDGTPGVTFTYDREGRTHTVTDAAGTLTRTYNLVGAIADESYSGTGPLSGQVIVRSFDDEERLDELSFGNGAYLVGWEYDTAGRVESITQGDHTAAYGYRANSLIVESVTYKEGSTIRGSIERKQDSLGRVWRADTYAGTTLAARREYTFDQANRRVEAVREDGRTWSYGYNNKSEVESAQLKQGPADPSPNAALPGYSFGYTFDDIGNRKTATTNGRQETLTSDLLNRLTKRVGAGHIQENFVDVRGTADPDVIVLINDAVATRTNEDFYLGVSVKTNSRAELKVQAVKTTPAVSVATETVGVRVPTNIQFEHDLDGNLRAHLWVYEWDAENRLKAAETESSGPAMVAGVPARQRIEYRYDAFGRCIERTVKLRNVNNTGWDTSAVTRYLYDAWNRIAELDGSAGNSVLRTYTWGTDVSGSYQGAGGVGGLLWADIPSGAHAAGYDGNGNIICWLDLATGEVSGRAEFSAFGEPLSRTGAAREITYGFSTKPAESLTGLHYYGFRWYDSRLGRWLSLDPIEERGGINMHGIVGNNVVNRLDLLGLRDIMINIYYNFPEGVVNDDVRRQFERIFISCLKKCDKDNKHSLAFSWKPTDKSPGELPLGKKGHFLGFSPKSLTFYARANNEQTMLGNQTGYQTGVNTRLIDAHVAKVVENRANAAVNSGGPRAATAEEIAQLKNLAVAVILAHEIGFHGIGGSTDWYFTTPSDWEGRKDRDGFVDSRTPRINFNSFNIEFSMQACKEIADELDID